MAAKASMRDVRRVNRALLMRHLVMTPETSRSTASFTTGLSPATITNVVTELLQDGTVVELGHLSSEGGRPRTVLALNPSAAIIFGADVSETEVGIDAFDLSLQRLAGRVMTFHDRRVSVETVVDFIATAVAALVEEIDRPDVRILGLGLGVPGVVENPFAADGAATTVHADVVGWGEVSLESLAERLGFPVLVDNGAKTTTQAEAWFGSAVGFDHAIVVLLGDGAGAGVITNGRLYRGSSSSAGEWGHTKIALDGPACRCGSRGCVETFIGASAVLSGWESRPAGSEAAAVDALLVAEQEGDHAATAVVGQLLERLGLALSNLVNLYNPQKIVVSGWFGDRLAAAHLERLAQITAGYSLKQPGNEAVLERSRLGHGAPTLGAASLALDHFIEAGWPH